MWNRWGNFRLYSKKWKISVLCKKLDGHVIWHQKSAVYSNTGPPTHRVGGDIDKNVLSEMRDLPQQRKWKLQNFCPEISSDFGYFFITFAHAIFRLLKMPFFGQFSMQNFMTIKFLWNSKIFIFFGIKSEMYQFEHKRIHRKSATSVSQWQMF